ncbi:AAA family ATPase [Chromobacterium sp. IIBBL 290-4]|uniref:AAA family ATPase n=1 Tax=Chromobacterium sp. IIBBL 290-4 TaxID=2953890 RepID=UPI0020B74CAC|nr:AAA family ATPase [Chromobacterium sp. IIBBL 290-4]UTH74434.1 AAA family ATPase [Chromobacterium sp. IIBBL 290-4]
MSEQSLRHPQAPSVSLACIELSRFRRLAQVRVQIDKKTTVLVGANNSGKTSILIAVRNFLATTGQVFGGFDISLEQWPALRALGEEWEKLAEDPASAAGDVTKWEGQLSALLACMPTLDLWFDVQSGSYNLVAPFITSLNWSGGAVGVRLRLEPATSVETLQKLAWRYREARQPVKALPKEANAWPADLIDYWLRYPADLGNVLVYKLDPAHGPLANPPASGPQALMPQATPVDRTKLSKLLRVDFVAAQRGLGSEEAETRSTAGVHRVGLFSNQLLKYARQHLNVATTGQGHQPELVAAIATAQRDLDARIKVALTPAIEDVKKLGYPTLHDPQEIHFRTRIQTGDLLDHSTAVQYRLDGQQVDVYLPEYSIGLGYQNLQSLSYQLVSFRDSRLKPAEGSPAAVHIVLVEEPEAHLHVQVQRIFPRRAAELISPVAREHAHLSSQLVISTHASHLAHAENFDRLRYVRRITTVVGGMPSSDVIDLATAFGTDKETRTFAERYFRVQHTDLLFADAAIFVEGAAERMLVPLFIERDFHDLDKRYISFLDLGGRHAHRLRPLVERLGIPTVVITDVDPVVVTKNASGKTVRKAAAIDDPKLLECGNDTLNSWHPKQKKLHLLAEPKEADLVWSNGSGGRVRFAWQVPVRKGSPWPSSFEDSLILTNIDWFKGVEQKKNQPLAEGEAPPPKLAGPLRVAVETVVAQPDLSLLAKDLHTMLRENFAKAEFAATMFERISLGDKVACPAYIADALAWLDKELAPSTRRGADGFRET